MKRNVLFNKKILLSFLILSFSFTLSSQIVNFKSLKTDNQQKTQISNNSENYSKADWTGQGMFRNYKPEDEIIEKRTRSSKHFRNADGTITALIAAGTSLNYEENGSWHSITREIETNNSSVYSHYPYANTHNAFKSYYPSNGGSDGILTTLKEGKINEWINPKMYFLVNGEKSNEQRINTANIEVNQNEIIYKNIYNNIDIKFVQNNDSRKMDIILNNSNVLLNAPTNATDLVFEETVKLPENWTTKEEKGCINIYDENNLWIARYEKPVFFDSGNDTSKESNNRISGNYSITKDDNNLIISVLIPFQWLKENIRKYPVFIDPTINIYPANTTYYTGYITQGGASKCNDSLYYIGGNLYNLGFMKFDLQSISSVQSISSAYLNFYCYYSLTAGSAGNVATLLVDPVTSTPSAIWNYNAYPIATGGWLCTNCWFNWPIIPYGISSIFSRRSSPGWEGFMLYTSHNGNWYDFYGYGNSIYKPYLVINYCETPGAPINLISTVTGTTTADLSWAAGTPSGSPLIIYCWQVLTTGGNIISSDSTISLNSIVSNLSAGTAYYFRVRTLTTCDTTYSAWDTSAVFSTLSNSCTTPGTPVSLLQIVAGQTTVALQWSAGTPAGSPTVTYYWEIYTSGGVLVTSGSTPGTSAVASTLTCGTTYYFKVRAFTSCDNSYSLWATSTNFITAACSCVTPGAPVNLSSTVTGSSTATLSWSAGTPAGNPVVSFYWEVYTTGGVYVTGGSSATSPALATGLGCGTKYYFRVRAYTTCDGSYSSWVLSSTFTTAVIAPVSPLSLTSNINNICPNTGGNIILSSSGGTGSVFAWYYLACGVNALGTGVNITLSAPNSTTTYYSRWESACGQSTCLSITISVLSLPIVPDTVFSDLNYYCAGTGGNIHLTATGGSGTTLFWYTGGCGTTSAGTGNTITKTTPTNSLNYYVRWQNSCGNSSCLSIAIVAITTTTPTSLIAFPATISCGGSTNLSASTTTGIIRWWDAATGGNYIGTSQNGTFLNITPFYTTTYYAESYTGIYGSLTFNYTGTIQTFTVPTGVLIISVDASGASGGSYYTYPVGLGGRVQTNLNVSQGQILNIFVGGQGVSTTGGWNGGGNGGGYGGCGGGASDIRTGGTGLLNRIVVAGGGGGSSGYGTGPGGDGGGTTGGNGLYNGVYNTSYCGAGGTATSGGAGALGGGGSGSLGIGGAGSINYYGAGGGGGYFGGGGSYNTAGGGGGSSWVIGTGSSNTIHTQGFNSGNGQIIISWIASNCSSSRTSVTVTMTSVPIIPSVTATPQVITCGGTVNLNAVSAGSIIQWWDSPSGGNILDTLASGSNFTVSPTITTNYYADAILGICYTPRISVTITVNPISHPTSVSANPVSLICGGNSNLSATTFSGIIRWWNSATGGTLLGTSASGISFSVYPALTTTYYAEAFNNPCTSSRVSVSVTVIAITPPTSVTATPNTLTCGGTTNLTATSVSGITKWWDASTGGNLVGTSQNGTLLTIYPPFGNTTYYAESYTTTQITQTFNYTTSTIITWTVPTGITLLNIDARGASGGYLTGTNAGRGARMVGDFSVNSGDILSILIGQSPGLTTMYPGGGGGTYVAYGSMYSTATPLIVAGGGGSAYSGTGIDAPTTTSGTGSTPGVNGNGGNSSMCVGGGGGYYSSGAGVNSGPMGYFAGGSGFQLGGSGSCPPSNLSGSYQCGGFGGGTAADRTQPNCSTYGGSGGGYSGGSGNNMSNKTYGEAGGSFNGGINQVNTSGFNTGNGLVIISWYVTACVSSMTGVTVSVSGLPVLNSATASPNTIGCGTSSSLNATSSTGNLIKWWNASTGGNLVGTSSNGVNFIVSPFVSSVYYAEANLFPCFSARKSVTITVTQISSPTSVLSSPSSVSCGGSANLFAVSSSGFVRWWNSATGGSSMGSSLSGVFLYITPLSTTTYYAEDYNPIAGSQTFSYSGTVQNWTVPNGIYSVYIDMSGAQGSGILSGLGGRVQTNLSVIPGQYLYLFVGSQNTNGGWNGGGIGGGNNPGGGGGATDIRIGGTTLTNRVIVAGGGGGGAGATTNGGVGGGLTGGNGLTNNAYNGIYCGGGGSQTLGGLAASSNSYGITATPGVLGIGGNACSSGNSGGGGGGGYYGGGGGTGSGGGGSSWTDTLLCSNTIHTQGYQSGNGNLIISWDGTGCISSRVSVTVTVNSNSPAPTSVTANPSTVNCGDSTQLSAINTGGIIRWWTNSTGGTMLGTSVNGAMFTITPTGTITYYAEGFNICASSTRISVTVTVNLLSIPTNVTATPSTISSGSSSTLSLTGGNLGAGAAWKWYTGSCGGTLIGFGSSVIQSPSVTTMYFVRGESICNTTLCVSTTIVVSSLSVAATSASATPSAICPGSSTILSLSGGNLGAGANWYWYTGSCGGTYIFSGASPVLSPTIATTYYVRAQGTLNTTTCVSTTVTINTLSTPATSATGTSPICTGASTTLSFSGGSIGTGASWNWYTGSCGGTYLTSGASPVLSPTITTTYYILAQGTCNTTPCVNTTVILNTSSIAATSATATPSTISPCSSSTLSLTGGSLGTSATWKWYTVSCGGTLIGSGLTKAQSPTVTTIYYVRAEGICNTTICKSTTIVVSSLSVAATSSLATPSAICPGSSTILSLSGGSLGAGANWFWYSGSCGGTYVFSGASPVLNPTIATTYYVRAQGTLNTTTCVSTIVTINTLSTPATSATGTSPICVGASTTLSFSGGSIGTGASWKWYTGSCGGSYLTSGASPVLSPTITTTYYVLAQGTCNTTPCVNTTVILNTSSIAATSAIATPSTINSGSSSTLSLTGGSLGISATWKWYTVSCGGTLIGSGLTKVQSPTVTTIYYVRAEGTCNSTICVSTTIVVSSLSVAATSATATPSGVCPGSSTTLSLSGGSLGAGANWYWYTGSCGGTYVISGATPVLSPTIATTYYVRAQGTLNTTTCVTTTVTINSLSSPANSIFVSGTTLCLGNSDNLFISGGNLGSGANWNWYSGTCAGTYIISGLSIIQSPTITTIYYVRAEGICNTTSCVSKTIIVIALPSQPSQITGNINPQAGHSEQYSVIYDFHATSYSWSLPSGWTGTSSTNSVTCIVGTGLGSITVIPSNVCGAGLARTLRIDGTFSISGNFYYNNSTNPLDSIWVFLKQNGNIIDSVKSDINGHYHFNGVTDGTYNINATTTKPWNGVNATDAVKVKRHFAGTELLTSSIRLHAADVNLSYNINTTDAAKISRRFVGTDNSFQRGNWVFEKPLGGDTINVSVNMNDTVIVNGSNVTQNFDGLCVGDVNASNVPLLKSDPKIDFDIHDFLRLKPNELFEIPIIATSNISVGAISMILKYPKEKVTINNIQLSNKNEELRIKNEDDNLVYNVIGDELKIGWFESESALKFKINEPIIIIRGKTTGNFNSGDVIKFSIANNSLCEFADENGNAINNLVLKTYSIKYATRQDIESIGSDLNNDLFIFPNPAENSVNIRYNIANDGFVQISLYNVLGEKVIDVLSNYVLKGNYNSEILLKTIPEGVYLCKMIYGENNFIVRKIIVSK